MLSTESFGGVVNHLAELIYEGQLDPPHVKPILQEHGLEDIQQVKTGILDLILAYISLVLEDNYVTTKEEENVQFLKRFFKVKEGDFWHQKYADVELLLEKQFEHMYQDNRIDTMEALQKVDLQELFDLSYDQFLEVCNKAAKAALARGADPTDLDTFMRL